MSATPDRPVPRNHARRHLLRLTLGSAAAAALGTAGRAQGQGPARREPVIHDRPPFAAASPSSAAFAGPHGAAIMVAGPPDTAASRWATLLATPLAHTLRPAGALSLSSVGGRDGVTGANAYEALAAPDGSTALLVPGAAAMAWLAGDPRVHFDAGRWVPALASFGSALLLGRTGPQPATLRVAASTPGGLELPALLGLSLLGNTPSPVFGLSDPDDAYAALLEGHVDAVLLTGRDVPRRAAALSGPRFAPMFSFGPGLLAPDDQGGLRDPALPGVATLPELYRARTGRAPAGPLFAAWQATAAAARLDAALVLQPLTPPALVAQWRLACSDALDEPGVDGPMRSAGLTALPAPTCVPAMASIVADAGTVLALRRWIASRPDWRPA